MPRRRRRQINLVTVARIQRQLLWIILAILVFGGLWGFWGIFFAIPLATVVQAVLKAWPRGKKAELANQETDGESQTSAG